MIRVLFLGTPDFAVASLDSLLAAPELEVIGVITQPDRPAGRGRHLTAPPVKRVANRSNIPLLQPSRIRNNQDAHQFARQLRPDVMAVVAFGQILPESFFQIPPFGALNVHASLLPRHRGAAPVAHALLQGDRETGVTIMRIDRGMDTGDMLAVERVPVDADVTAGELSEQLAQLGGTLLARTIPGWVAGEIEACPQPEEGVSYAPRLEKRQARIDWTRSAAAIHNQIRAFNPWPVALTRFRGESVKLWASRDPQPEPTGSLPGTIIALTDAEVRVACGDGGSLAVTELQPPNRRRLNARDFVNGWQIRAGERFNGFSD